MPGPDRDLIRLSVQEVDDLLHECRKVQVATIGPDGAPHVVPMFFVVHDGRVVFWTYAASQKVTNLHRDPRITCLVELGERTEEVRFAQVRGRAVVDDDPALVARVGRELHERYVGTWTPQAARDQARRGRRRVVVTVEPDRVVTWDHRKLPANHHGPGTEDDRESGTWSGSTTSRT